MQEFIMCSYLPGQLWEEVLVSGEGPQAVQVADGGRQRLQLITTTVQLLQQRQTGWKEQRQKGRDAGKMTGNYSAGSKISAATSDYLDMGFKG